MELSKRIIYTNDILSSVITEASIITRNPALELVFTVMLYFKLNANMPIATMLACRCFAGVMLVMFNILA